MTSTILIENSASEILSKDEQEIRDIIEGLHRAHYRKDAEATAAPYATDATIFNLAPPLVHHGVSVQEKRAWFDSWETPIEIVPRDLTVTVSGDFAFAHCLLHMSGTKKGPEGSVHFWMRETMCFERIRGSWRIVHEHTSVPFYMDGSLRPAFDLQP
ncbi:MAG TPA: nuclear transport factor 2 family protein [Terracidiphilus sp.]|jgi:ketosteroid isomerase-like protein|nr:nuclear transport factor 2 family protein [Terracidiphilus sp.]